MAPRRADCTGGTPPSRRGRSRHLVRPDLIECDRVLLRAVALKELTEAEAADRRAHLIEAASHWQVLRIAAEIVDRAREPFPGDRFEHSMLSTLHRFSWRAPRSLACGCSASTSVCARLRRGWESPSSLPERTTAATLRTPSSRPPRVHTTARAGPTIPRAGRAAAR